MGLIQVELSDAALRGVRQHADRASLPVDRMIVAAVDHWLAAQAEMACLEERARRGRGVDIAALLAKVPDVPPVPGDELE